MRELFTPKGHLTDHAFALLREDEPELLSRLEVAEHLAFCDECLLRYTQALDEMPLMAPPASLTGPVMEKVKKRRVTILIPQLMKAMACVCLALSMWAFGGPKVTSLVAPRDAEGHYILETRNPATPPEAYKPPASGIVEALQNFSSSFRKTAQETAQNAVDTITNGGQQQAAPEEDTTNEKK